MKILFPLLFVVGGCVHVHLPASSAQDMVLPLALTPTPITPWDRTNYALLDPLAVASSRAAEEAFGAKWIVLPVETTPEALPGTGGQPSTPTLENLEQDVRAIQRWIGAQETR